MVKSPPHLRFPDLLFVVDPTLKRLFFTLIALLIIKAGLSQNEIPVDMYTGTPSIQVPIAIVDDHDLKEYVSLSYAASGVRVGESSGIAGVGWALKAGGAVRRIVRGLPDDFTGVSSDLRRGWMYGGSTKASSFSNSSDLSSSTCSDETSDYGVINGAGVNAGFSNTIDSEPDLFEFNFGDVSGKFVLDNDGSTIRLIPFQDIKIEYTTVSSSDKRILSFIITTNEGNKYTFDLRNSVTRSTTKIATTVDFLATDFNQYDYSRYSIGVDFSSEWSITKAESPSGAFINFIYSASNAGTSVDTVRVGIRDQSTSTILKDIYKISTAIDNKQLLTSIEGSAGMKVNFSYSLNLLTQVTITDTKRPQSIVKAFNFFYKDINPANIFRERFFLESLQEQSGCDKKPPAISKIKGLIEEKEELIGQPL